MLAWGVPPKATCWQHGVLNKANATCWHGVSHERLMLHVSMGCPINVTFYFNNSAISLEQLRFRFLVYILTCELEVNDFIEFFKSIF